ncbi:hypothetical protein MAPG_09089 [Magnaporthiopsis poae ATCC 64411]|uniref:F-box domain-containing protein n=1 Tax=Magnaporthiopsis poae (strain ATCC 64411 / 73-15) TaxID=644358 RepID=A0A0C4E913_MAGP6|nr:hypothetical protein MAPG_09089 [Magnaporthiopsis poae ATCC 64411]
MEKPSQSPLESLCDELLLQIVSHLDTPDVLTLRKTSPRLASVSADSFGDSFFGCLKTDLSLRSLARLFAIARTEHIRRRVRVLHISPFPWRSSVCPYDDASRGGGPTRKKGWFRDADGRLDLTTPTAVSLLRCIRDDFPRCRSTIRPTSPATWS